MSRGDGLYLGADGLEFFHNTGVLQTLFDDDALVVHTTPFKSSSFLIEDVLTNDLI